MLNSTVLKNLSQKWLSREDTSVQQNKEFKKNVDAISFEILKFVEDKNQEDINKGEYGCYVGINEIVEHGDQLFHDDLCFSGALRKTSRQHIRRYNQKDRDDKQGHRRLRNSDSSENRDLEIYLRTVNRNIHKTQPFLSFKDYFLFSRLPIVRSGRNIRRGMSVAITSNQPSIKNAHTRTPSMRIWRRRYEPCAALCTAA